MFGNKTKAAKKSVRKTTTRKTAAKKTTARKTTAKKSTTAKTKEQLYIVTRSGKVRGEIKL